MADDDSPEIQAAKRELLEVSNALRAIRGEPPLTNVPTEFCSFCARPKEDVGALVQGLRDFVFICRECVVEAQRAFLRDQPEAKE
jgi:hypothetical protein